MNLPVALPHRQTGRLSSGNGAFCLWMSCISLATTMLRSLRKTKLGLTALWMKPRRPNAERELTIEEIVTDPIVCDLMRADHVDPDAFETLLRSAAARSVAVNPFVGRPPSCSGGTGAHEAMNGAAVRALTWIKATSEVNEP